MRIFIFLFIFIFSSDIKAQDDCGIKVPAFASGEELNYHVIYNWGMVWLESGYASFKVTSAKLNNRKCYRLNGTGNTYPKYDWFFKVRDVFETYVDSQTLRPLKFQADILEGKKHDKHTYIFNNPAKKVYTI